MPNESIFHALKCEDITFLLKSILKNINPKGVNDNISAQATIVIIQSF